MMTTTYSVYELAHMAGVNSPDGPNSPGALWLEQVAASLAEAIDYRHDQGDDQGPVDDVVHELADTAVPIYTHERWKIFVDLGAYNFDADDLGRGEDITAEAGIILYQVAEALIWSIWYAEATANEASE